MICSSHTVLHKEIFCEYKNGPGHAHLALQVLQRLTKLVQKYQGFNVARVEIANFE